MTEYSCIYEMGIWLAMLAILVKTNLMDKAEKKERKQNVCWRPHRKLYTLIEAWQFIPSSGGWTFFDYTFKLR